MLASFLLSAALTAHRGGLLAAVRTYNGPDTRAVQLLAGCALACVTVRHLPRLARRAAGRVGPAALSGLVLWVLLVADARATPRLWVVLPAVAALAALVVLVLAVAPRQPVTRPLPVPWFSWPGRRLSYAIYLRTTPCCCCATRCLPRPRPGR